MNRKLAAVLVLLFALQYKVYPQGCSDAGVCTAGGLRPHAEMADTLPRGSLALNLIAGEGDQAVFIFTPQLELTSRISARNSIQLKLPYTFASGNLGNTSGLGDIVITGMQRFIPSPSWSFTVNAGVKLAMNQADKKTGNKPLPMPYQTSLGTHDALLGFSAAYRNKWFMALGLQVPLVQGNKNGFYTADTLWAGNPDAGQYFNSKELNRRADITLRIERLFAIRKSVIYAGVLPIYHLGHDRYTNQFSDVAVISGSKGLTLNLTAAYGLHITPKMELNLRVAAPVITRKVRPDGLTRHWVSSLMLAYSF